ncbi:GbsR/MarR family transcriptional regulator [Roseivivax sp. THAF30]|jgi:DNA-binding transcriptional regulator GbsR (MarR family)|uniref:GbsR/MarR family transcriptional regulator n=1 Tax=Roseivivax sp. THAF30 TaxID=2587852 RepID=UPI0012679B2C|nr:MarR family transcriptional regulator [Roseivivax sp. THAF30]QFT62651.1 MarR family protein [Roseivivax sp. THAF30]
MRTENEFILHFGEMGSRWGINRTVGQIYALLFLSEAPLCADDICERLGFSRSNVSMGLKELQAWRLVRRRDVPDDRREHFSTPDDLMTIVRTLVEERKRREIDPTLSKLRELEIEGQDASDYASARITELRQLIEELTNLYEDLARIETEKLRTLLKAGSTLSKLVTATGRVIPLRGGSDTKEAN